MGAGPRPKQDRPALPAERPGKAHPQGQAAESRADAPDGDKATFAPGLPLEQVEPGSAGVDAGVAAV